MIVSLEPFDDISDQVFKLAEEHYKLIQERYNKLGVRIPDCNPNKDAYFNAFYDNELLSFVVRNNQELIAYNIVFLSTDIHNGQLIAEEAALFVHEDYRRSKVAKSMIVITMDELRRRGVKRYLVGTRASDAAIPLWEHLGFSATNIEYQINL